MKGPFQSNVSSWNQPTWKGVCFYRIFDMFAAQLRHGEEAACGSSLHFMSEGVTALLPPYIWFRSLAVPQLSWSSAH